MDNKKGTGAFWLPCLYYIMDSGGMGMDSCYSGKSTVGSPENKTCTFNNLCDVLSKYKYDNLAHGVDADSSNPECSSAFSKSSGLGGKLPNGPLSETTEMPLSEATLTGIA